MPTKRLAAEWAGLTAHVAAIPEEYWAAALRASAKAAAEEAAVANLATAGEERLTYRTRVSLSGKQWEAEFTGMTGAAQAEVVAPRRA
eukprot:4858538-Pleurochrysis_carterae.AAC.2